MLKGDALCNASVDMPDMPGLHAPKEAALPQLRSTEGKLAKNPEQATAYQDEVKRLLQAGYSEKLQPEEVEQSKESWYIPHHMVQHNDKNRIVYNCSFMYAGHNLNELLLPGSTLGPSLLSCCISGSAPSPSLVIYVVCSTR